MSTVYCIDISDSVTPKIYVVCCLTSNSAVAIHPSQVGIRHSPKLDSLVSVAQWNPQIIRSNVHAIDHLTKIHIGCVTSLPPAGSCTKLQCSFSICASDTSEVNTDNLTNTACSGCSIKSKLKSKHSHSVWCVALKNILKLHKNSIYRKYQKYRKYLIFSNENIRYRRYISSQPWL